MLILELFEPTADGYRSEKDDNSVMKLSDLRKTQLSLDRINRMRMMNDVRKLEHEKKLEKVAKQYGAVAADAAGGGAAPATI